MSNNPYIDPDHTGVNDAMRGTATTPEVAAADSTLTNELQKTPNTDPRFVIDHVGKIPFTAHGNHYTGCKVVQFISGDDLDSYNKPLYRSAVERVNAYFEENQGLLVVAHSVASDGECITLIVTRTLTDAQLMIVSKRAHIIEAMVQEEMEKEAKTLEEAEARVISDEKRLRELAAVGEKCLSNHGATIKQLREKVKAKRK